MSSALWKNGGSDPDAFGIICRTGPGIRHVVGFGIGPREGVLFGANFGRTIVTNGDLFSQRRGPLSKLLWAYLFNKAHLNNFMTEKSK